MKLDIVTPLKLEFGGGFERFCIDLAARLSERGDSVTITALDWVPHGEERLGLDEIDRSLGRAGVTYSKVPISSRRSDRFPLVLPSTLRYLVRSAARSDLVYLNNAYPPGGMVALLATALAGRTPIISGHHSVLVQGHPSNDLAVEVEARTTWRGCTASHVLNSRDERFLRDRGRRNVFHIPIPMDPGRFPLPDPTSAGSTCRLLYLGRLEPQKGVDLLLDALPLLRSTLPPTSYELTIAGSGSLEPRVTEVVRHDDRVRHVVPDDRMKLKLLAESDLLVMPSRRESFGIVTAEAMMAGLAVVGLRQAGAGELIQEGETGFEIPRLTSESVAASVGRAVRQWFQDPKGVRELGRKGRQLAIERFSSDRVFPRYLEMFDATRVRNG
ncbi:MAG: glycosyltransferase family 4 protein [Thermoplasmata archaeon]